MVATKIIEHERAHKPPPSRSLTRGEELEARAEAHRARGELAKALECLAEAERVYADDDDDAVEERPSNSPPLSAMASTAGMAQMASTCVADVERQEVRWLWTNRFAFGKLGILEGQPGVGKSTLALEIAARLTRGEPMPDSAVKIAPASVLILSAEDAIADTIRPRLEASGANLSLVHVAECDVTIGDVSRLRSKLIETGAKLLIIDPLDAFLPKNVNAHHNTDVRRVLMPLAKLAEELDVAVLVIRHLQKAPVGNAVVAGQGSIGIIGAARTALLAAQDRDDPTLVTLALVKSNLGPRPSALDYRLVAAPALGCARVEWQGTSDKTADDLIGSMHEEPADRTRLAETVKWLRARLAAGSEEASAVIDAGKTEGIPKRRIERAAQRLRVKSHRDGFGAKVMWELDAE